MAKFAYTPASACGSIWMLKCRSCGSGSTPSPRSLDEAESSWAVPPSPGTPGCGRLPVVIRVICVGRARGPLAEASAEYEERLARACKFDLHELKEEGTPSLSPREAMLRERARIEPLIAGYWVVALDRSGVQRSSKQIADLVREREERPPQRTAFVLGGPHGIDETLLAEADLTWSLGKGTLPHQLARVVVLEQLYRAFTILRGEPYHR